MHLLGRRNIVTCLYVLFYGLLSVRWKSIDFSGKDLTVTNTLDLFQIVFSYLTSNVHLYEISILFLSLILLKAAHCEPKGYYLFLFFLTSMIGPLFINQTNWSLGIAFFIFALARSTRWPLLGAITAHPAFIPFVGIVKLKMKQLVLFSIVLLILYRSLIVYVTEFRSYLSFIGYSVQDVEFSLEPVAYFVLIYMTFFFIRGEVLNIDKSQFRIPYVMLAISFIISYYLGLEVLFYRTLSLSIVLMFFYIANSKKNYVLVFSGFSLWIGTLYFYEYKLGFLRFVIS